MVLYRAIWDYVGLYGGNFMFFYHFIGVYRGYIGLFRGYFGFFLAFYRGI